VGLRTKTPGLSQLASSKLVKVTKNTIFLLCELFGSVCSVFESELVALCMQIKVRGFKNT